MTASSAKSSSAKAAKLRTAAPPRAGNELTPEEKLLRAIFGESNLPATTALTVERARRRAFSKAAAAGAEAEFEDQETLDLIGGLLDSVALEVGSLNQELSSSMERLAGKQRDGLGR